ncbi:S-layer homology domain-containing protein [Sporosarcina trichiuri]|uniref:S-layer homology domain-containing protein n=1 Tax=Sporosarcina trichiuri TaxID=3056445 RepID=UPI0025B483FD|nr:S-layer homology domain-containing protein [Sporosarcina sp. 0.2-SM1T-5]WJY26431.1 S-layer homology domain-containing protein [Sporosarcina sp. 0.2-SM1T-5]
MKNRTTARKTYMAVLSAAVASGAIVAAVPAQNAEAAVSFKDVSSKTPHASAIHALAERGVVTGFADGSFRPMTQLKRSEAAQMLAKSLGLDTKKVKNPGFTDVKSGAWYYGAVAALSEAGVIDGYKDGSFRPDQQLTRSEISKFLVTAYDLTGSYSDENPFTDVKADKWYAKYVLPLYATGITTGKSSTVFAPDRGVGRGEFATFIVRAEQYLAKADTAVEQMRKDIRAIVEMNEDYKDKDGKVVATAKFDKPSNLLTLTANTPDAVDMLQGTGIFSEKLPKLGVTAIKIGSNEPVDVTKDHKAAKAMISQQLKDLMDTSNVSGGEMAAKNVPVRLFAQTGDAKIWEDFNLTLVVKLP